MTATVKERAMKRGGAARTRRGEAFCMPPMDLYENEGGLLLRLEMPGVGEDGVSVNIEDRVLSIEGTMGADVPEGYRLVHAEYGEGMYQRRFELPRQTDSAGVTARMKDGILRVELPNKEDTNPRKVDVKIER